MARLVFVLALGWVTACADDVRRPHTWYDDVGPIVRTKCAGCHRPGGIAPFSLYDYADAYEQIDRMIEAVDAGKMPPFSALEPADCTPRHAWRDDPRLTGAERNALHAWVNAGAPAGASRALAEPPTTALEGANVQLAPAQPFVSSGNRDQFVCVLFDPQVTEPAWLTGAQVFPSAPELVHHVNVDLVAPGDAEAAIAALGGVGMPHLGCDNPPGTPIQSWLPGNPALVLPTSVGIPVPAGTLVAIQIHYHPAGGGGPDATSVALRLSDTKPAWGYQLGVYGNVPGPPKLQPDPDDPPSGPVFVIPANKPDHVETMVIPHGADIARELRVLSVTPHMHLLGTHERATVTHADGDRECLIDSGWDFDWQRTYGYDAELDQLPRLEPSSTVTVSCHWNNTFDNPNLSRMLYNTGTVAPYDVQLGLTTAHEMCLADFGIVSPY